MPNIHNKAKKKRMLLRRQKGLCWLCRKPMALGDATFDHIIPKSKLGGSAMANLALAHEACNRARGASLESVFIEANGLTALRWNIKSVGFV